MRAHRDNFNLLLPAGCTHQTQAQTWAKSVNRARHAGQWKQLTERQHHGLTWSKLRQGSDNRMLRQQAHKGSARDLCNPVSNATTLAASSLKSQTQSEPSMYLHMGSFYTPSTAYASKWNVCDSHCHEALGYHHPQTESKGGGDGGGIHALLRVVRRQLIHSLGLPPLPLRHPLRLAAASTWRWLSCAGVEWAGAAGGPRVPARR